MVQLPGSRLPRFGVYSGGLRYGGVSTRGEFRVVDVATDGSFQPNEALRLAAAVERDSEHTIAQGIVKSAEEQQLTVPRTEQFEAIPGHGVRAIVEGREYYMGGPAMLRRLKLTPAAAVGDASDRATSRGQASVYLLTSTRAVAAFAVADAVRPESRDAIQRLHQQQIEVVMLTGDAKAVADAVAADLGIHPGRAIERWCRTCGGLPVTTSLRFRSRLVCWCHRAFCCRPHLRPS